MILQQNLYFISHVLSIISGFILAVNGLKDRIIEIPITFKALKSTLIKILIFTIVILLIITLIVTIICFIGPFGGPTYYYEGPRSPYMLEPPIPASLAEIKQGRQEAFKILKEIAFCFYTYIGLATVPIICFLFITISVQKFTNLVLNYLISTLYVVLALIGLVVSFIIYIFAFFSS
jgi:hypothetical protein